MTAVDVGVCSIDKYANPGCTPQAQLDFCKALAGGFAGAMRSMGHQVAFARRDADANPKLWEKDGDNGTFGIDTVDFALLATHGGTYGKELRPRPNQPPDNNWLYLWIGTFDSPHGCIISTIKVNASWNPPDLTNPVTNMSLGERRLRWLVLEACMSIQIGLENLVRSTRAADWKNDRIQDAVRQLTGVNPKLTWSRCFDGLNILFGFTGLSSDYSGTCKRTVTFGRRAGRGEVLGDSWLDEAYSYWNDDVPVALACGASEADASKRVNKESLKAISPQLRAANIGGYAWIWRI